MLRSIILWIKIRHWGITESCGAHAILVLLILAIVKRHSCPAIFGPKNVCSFVPYLRGLDNNDGAPVCSVRATNKSARWTGSCTLVRLAEDDSSSSRSGVRYIFHLTPNKILDFVFLVHAA